MLGISQIKISFTHSQIFGINNTMLSFEDSPDCFNIFFVSSPAGVHYVNTTALYLYFYCLGFSLLVCISNRNRCLLTFEIQELSQ